MQSCGPRTKRPCSLHIRPRGSTTNPTSASRNGLNLKNLGVLSDGEYALNDAAYAGTVACLQSSEDSYVAWLQDPANSGLEGLSAEELSPAWIEAQESLCPDDGGPVGGKRVTVGVDGVLLE